MEGLIGFEPIPQESKSCVLPLHYKPIWYSTLDSNQDLTGLKPDASSCWASGVLYGRRDLNPQSPDPKSGAFTILATPAFIVLCRGIEPLFPDRKSGVLTIIRTEPVVWEAGLEPTTSRIQSG